jgi:uracil-DNA glycosylase
MRDYQKSTIDSYLGWWEDAGLTDPVQEDGAIWLQSAAPVAAPQPEPKRAAAPLPSAEARVSAPPPAAFDHSALPGDLISFDQWLSNDPALPGAHWSAQRIAPAGPAAAPLMVISDMPDADDLAAGHLLAGAVGELFDAMLGAIGHQRAASRLASIALTHAPGGRWDDETAGALRTIMLHHIRLAAPARLLLLGQQTCRLLTGDDVPAEGHGLRNINHYGATVAAVAIHHPRLLLNRQALKRGAWTALKQFREPA